MEDSIMGHAKSLAAVMVFMLFGCASDPTDGTLLPKAKEDASEHAGASQASPTDSTDMKPILDRLDSILLEMGNLSSEMKKVNHNLERVNNHLANERLSVVIKNPRVSLSHEIAFYRKKTKSEIEKYESIIDSLNRDQGHRPGTDSGRFRKDISKRYESKMKRYKAMQDELGQIRDKAGLAQFVEDWSIEDWRKEMLMRLKND
jgi:hypothetical protein